jgi:hypothetical protein
MSRAADLIEAEGLKGAHILQVEVSLLPSDGGPRIVASSDGGELPRLAIVSGSVEGWGPRIVAALTPIMGERPAGKIEAAVWLDGKKSGIRRRIMGTLGQGGGGGAGGPGLRFPGLSVTLDAAFALVDDQTRSLRAEAQALRAMIADLVRQISDTGNRAMAVVEAIPAAQATAMAIAQSASGGVLGQLATGIAGAVFGVGPGGGGTVYPGGGAPPPRIAYPIRGEPDARAMLEAGTPGGTPGGSQGGTPGGSPDYTPTPERVAGALEQVGPEVAIAAIEIWIIAHPSECLRRVKASPELQKALKIPPFIAAGLKG